VQGNQGKIILTTAPLLTAAPSGNVLELRPSGSWTATNAAALERLSETVSPQLDRSATVRVDMTEVRELDTLGAWLLEKMLRRATSAGHRAETTGVSDNYAGLIEEVRQVNRRVPAPVPARNPIVAKIDDIGRATIGAREDVTAFLQMLGLLCVAILGVLRRPRSLRLTSLTYQLYRVGWQAIPIVVLITFLIGAIIAQQGIFHFRKFGADSYVVDMVGILVLRELGVLIVAIMVAGRSGSAYTAELGSMKMREEIDALSTMGLDPIEVLMLPRIIALICALPILTFIGSVAALYGGGLVAWFYGGMGPAIFIARLHEAVSVTHFEVGIIKAPFMALVIGIVACSEGLRVKGSAESLGKQTTTSVVKSIFLVIVLDGLFAVFFASIGM
jgi:phospholipid/cholesterol/gamma-HCH transport system permease protein